MHGDGVPIQKNQSTEIILWNFPSMPWAERLLFGCIETLFMSIRDIELINLLMDDIEIYF